MRCVYCKGKIWFTPRIAHWHRGCLRRWLGARGWKRPEGIKTARRHLFAVRTTRGVN